MRVCWTPSALADLRGHVAFLEACKPVATEQFLTTAPARAQSLASHPHRGRHAHLAGVRELTSVHPYTMLYEVDEATEAVVILRLWQDDGD